nr:MAG TPA: hypothetical protein [Caudoviricetes sp.]
MWCAALVLFKFYSGSTHAFPSCDNFYIGGSVRVRIFL